MSDTNEKLITFNLKEILRSGEKSIEQKIDSIDECMSDLNSVVVNTINNNQDKLDVKNTTDLIKTSAKIMNDIKSGLQKKAELIANEDVDFNHPKISRGMMYIIEMFINTMEEVNIDTSEFKKALAPKILGIEDKLNNYVGSVSEQSMQRLSNNNITSKE